MPITGLKICYGNLGNPTFPLFLFFNTPFHDTRNYDDEAVTLAEFPNSCGLHRVSHIRGIQACAICRYALQTAVLVFPEV